MFNLCQQREEIINTQTSILFTTPLSQFDTFDRSSCKCEIKSKNLNEKLDQSMTLVSSRMRQLLNNDRLSYSFGGHSVVETASANNEQFLKRSESVFIGNYSVKTASIELSSVNNQLNGLSRVFISLEPGKLLHSVKE